MAADYPWLDKERTGTVAVYAYAVHPRCICIWDMDHNGPSSQTSDTPALILIARKRGCKIHGEKGWV